MAEAIGIRLEKDMLNKIRKLEKVETLDRSSVIRKLILIGYNIIIKKQAAEEYVKGKITLSEAAHRAELTLWDMEEFLVEQGFKSSYSLQDLEDELRMLK